MTQNQLVNITTRGGVITAEFLENMKSEIVRNALIKPQTFATFNKPAPENQSKLDEQIYISFKNLIERWDAISNFYENMNISDTRKKWIIPLLRELGFDPQFNREDVLVEGDERLKFKLSHRGWVSRKAPLIQTVVAKQELEVKHIGGGRRRSPHDEMQTFLNVSKDYKWGIVTNGILFRILRDFFHTTTKGYVEFDVENIMRSRNYHEFMAFYRIAHASRFLEDEEGISPLEQFYKESVAAGVKVGQNLQGNVKQAIEVLGNGFLTPEHIQQMIEDEEFCKSYYSEILRVIYRILFLLYAEQRAMLPTRDSLYIEEYGITHLREIAERLKGEDNYNDLWVGLKVTFEMLSKGCEPLKVFPYNGSLFDDANIPTIRELKIKNHDLLEAIRCLTLIEEERLLKRINYLDLGVEEIGSIYESMLDFTPRVLSSELEINGLRVPANSFFLDPRGSARKTSGSYYTNPRLVDELINSALKPVAEKKMEEAGDKEGAILSLKVCDPACGSGAFLIAATNYLGKELAKVRTEQSEPPDTDMRQARRDVLQHCIYGVDLNPMAVELAKVSLWIDAAVKDLPLNFLDHHIKCGNSLIGTTPELIEKGIPAEAFNPIEGDDKKFAKTVKDKNKNERKQWTLEEFKKEEKHTWAFEYGRLSEFKETDIYAIKEKQECYNAIIDSPKRHYDKLIADTWCSSFFWTLQEDALPPPTEATIRIMRKEMSDENVEASMKSKILELSEEYKFFHWYLEFPDVFDNEDSGFDCVLGNPPWDIIQAEEIPWFIVRFEEIGLASGSKRKNLIKSLEKTHSNLYDDWNLYKKRIENSNKFFKNSNRFNLTSKGKLNYYPLFAEHDKQIINSEGRVGIVIASGIATDYFNQDFFQDLMENSQLVKLFDFENREAIFPGVHRSYKFSLLTLTGKCKPTQEADFVFYLTNLDQLKDEERHFSLTNEDIKLLNPNTRTSPIFRSKNEAELTKKIYQNHPVLIRDNFDGESDNSWGISFKQGLFNMTSDSYLFTTRDNLEENGFELLGNIFQRGDEIYMPLYEGKMIWQYDHRFAEISPGASGHGTIEATIAQHHNSQWEPLPRYWVKKDAVLNQLDFKDYKYFIGIRRFGRSTDERSSIATIIPFSGVGDNFTLIFNKNYKNPLETSILISILNSFVFDFMLRNKIGGMMINQFHLEQIATIAPKILNNGEFSKIIRNNILQLLFTSHSLTSFALDLNFDGSPFKWDFEKRALLKAELDAIIAHLYDLTRDELEYILETFPIVKRKDLEMYDDYRTKKMILNFYDEFKGNF